MVKGEFFLFLKMEDNWEQSSRVDMDKRENDQWGKVPDKLQKGDN